VTSTPEEPVSNPSAPAPKRGRGRPRDPETDKKILSAATGLLMQRGFEKMTVDDVAREAGVGKATVYRRWPSKSDLALAAMSSILMAEFPEPRTGSVVSDLREGILAAVRFANSEQGAAFIRMCVVEAMRDRRVAQVYRESSERRERQSRAAFEAAVDAGEVRPGARLDHALHWIGGLFAYAIITDRPMPREEDVPEMLEFVLRGILLH
jgi:AcrR family transcriptional regulator